MKIMSMLTAGAILVAPGTTRARTLADIQGRKLTGNVVSVTGDQVHDLLPVAAGEASSETSAADQ